MAVYDYRISSGATVANGTGWLNASLSSVNIVGGPSSPGPVPTAFTTQLHIGDILFVGSTTIGSIATISDDSHLTLTYGCPIVLSNNAFTYDPLVNVETLTTQPSAPKGDWQPWAVSMPTGDALARGLGRPLAQWRWNVGPTDFFPLALRDALRAYCPTKSARVYMRTRTFESSDKFATYQAAMLWPDKEDRDSRGVRKSFVIEFRDLVAI